MSALSTAFLFRAIKWLVYCIVLGFLVAGFIAGYTKCTDCKGVRDRVFLGIIWSFLSLLSLGRIPVDGAGYQILHIWPVGLGIAGGLLALRIGLWFVFR